MLRSLEFLLILLLSGVASFGQDCRKINDPNQTSVKVGAFDPKEYEGWKKVETRRFSFYIPPETSGGEKKCMEGGCYEFAGPDFILTIDINSAAGRPTYERKNYPSFCQ